MYNPYYNNNNSNADIWILLYKQKAATAQIFGDADNISLENSRVLRGYKLLMGGVIFPRFPSQKYK